MAKKTTASEITLWASRLVIFKVSNLPLVNGATDDGQPADHSDGNSSSSVSEEEGEEEESSSDSSQEGELSDQMQLKNAGVEIDLEDLGIPTEGGVAPLHLLSEVGVLN